MERLSEEKRRFKVDTRNAVDITLMGIAITLLGLIITIKPELLIDNPFLGVQLATVVPLFLCGLLSRIKEVSYSNSKRWTTLAHISFYVAYGFFINILGLILAFVAPIYLAMSFFAIDLILTVIRAGIVISYNPNEFKSRIVREVSQLLIIIFLGILPALRIY
jgi:hypothetical protein